MCVADDAWLGCWVDGDILRSLGVWAEIAVLIEIEGVVGVVGSSGVDGESWGTSSARTTSCGDAAVESERWCKTFLED